MPITIRGKMSWFGGPDDHGVKPDEGLALFEHSDVPAHPELFLDLQPEGTSGVARLLDPDALYVACRWVYTDTPRGWLRQSKVTVYNPENEKSVQVQPVDWGPNIATGRVADLSPGVLKALGLVTGDLVTVTIPLPGEPALGGLTLGPA